MKKIFLIFSLAILSLSSISQTSVITFAPLGIINKFRLKYEMPLNEYSSAGTYFNVYYAFFKGIRFDPIIRVYPGGSAPEGFYLQGKAIIGYFNSKIDYSYETATDTLEFEALKKFPTYGAGFGLGYQFIAGKSEIPIDIFLGFQYSKFTASNKIIKDGFEYTTASDALWYFTGPGSFLNMNFGIGFSF